MAPSDLDAAVARAVAGDRESFGGLYRAFAGPLQSYLLATGRARHDAEDLVAQTFLEAMRDIGRFRGNASGFRAWIFRIATHRSVDLARRTTRRAERPLDAAADHQDPHQADETAIRRLEHGRLWEAVKRLPEEQRRVIALRLAGGLTSGEIADVVGKRVGAVKALQHRALVNLARALGVPRDGAATLSE